MYDLNLSWMLLRQQQEWLGQHACPEAEGLLSLIDSLQRQGAKVVGNFLVYGKENDNGK